MSKARWLGWAKNEWLLGLSALGLLVTSLALGRVPSYTASDFQVLYILLVLFVITTGLRQHNALAYVAGRLEQGRFLAAKLVLATFFFSMLVTNDVALLSVVPLTVLLHVERKAWLVVLETLAANAGSALSPFGNPQNLFLYWFYDVPLGRFVTTIAPFSAVFLVLLLGGAFLVRVGNTPPTAARPVPRLHGAAYVYLGALGGFALAIVHVLPLSVGGVVLLYALLADRRSLRVDYALLATFACFFGFTDNLRVLLAGVLARPQHVFLLSALLSQGISNVPAALLVADFTPHWQALLWGVSVGGFGSLVGSLANLIAYRIYTRQAGGESRRFLLQFHLASYAAFFVGAALYALLLME